MQRIEASLARKQPNVEVRLAALALLRAIHKKDFTLVNLLWKRCKSTFEIQPYNEIPREDLQLGEEIGSGSFGKVYKGYWQPKRISNQTAVQVAVKIIPENSQLFDLDDLRGEACLPSHCISISLNPSLSLYFLLSLSWSSNPV